MADTLITLTDSDGATTEVVKGSPKQRLLERQGFKTGDAKKAASTTGTDPKD